MSSVRCLRVWLTGRSLRAKPATDHQSQAALSSPAAAGLLQLLTPEPTQWKVWIKIGIRHSFEHTIFYSLHLIWELSQKSKCSIKASQLSWFCSRFEILCVWPLSVIVFMDFENVVFLMSGLWIHVSVICLFMTYNSKSDNQGGNWLFLSLFHTYAYCTNMCVCVCVLCQTVKYFNNYLSICLSLYEAFIFQLASCTVIFESKLQEGSRCGFS